MNNKNISIGLFLVLLAGPFAQAEVAVESERSGIIEAPDAIVGRVFGVQGSGADIQHHVFEMTSHTPRNAAVRSAIVPGWGQAFNQDRVKGTLFFLTTTAAVFGSLSQYKKSRDSYDDYQHEGLKDGPSFDDYEKQHTAAVALGAAAIFLYAFGIYDAHHGAYDQLYTQKPSIDVVVTRDSSEVVWSRKF